jgi:hypothetical protein
MSGVRGRVGIFIRCKNGLDNKMIKIQLTFLLGAQICRRTLIVCLCAAVALGKDEPSGREALTYQRS